MHTDAHLHLQLHQLRTAASDDARHHHHPRRPRPPGRYRHRVAQHLRRLAAWLDGGADRLRLESGPSSV